tara:strand:- start:182 stop:670 length:489 start_codon:yes stop_codon:yes gene_type:complete
MSNTGSFYKHHFENSKVNTSTNQNETVEELLIDGDKGGLTIKSFIKKGSTKTKINIKENGDKYSIRIQNDDKTDDMEVNMAKLKEYLGKNKNLAFGLNYINKEMTAFRKSFGKETKKRVTRKKTSKKKSKKVSRKKVSKKKVSKKKVSRKKTSRKKTSRKKK